jgi:hypothetical protein
MFQDGFSTASAAAKTLASYAGTLRMGRSYFVTMLRCTPGTYIREKVASVDKYYLFVCRKPADASSYAGP